MEGKTSGNSGGEGEREGDSIRGDYSARGASTDYYESAPGAGREGATSLSPRVGNGD